jgi:hypothetical protein
VEAAEVFAVMKANATKARAVRELVALLPAERVASPVDKRLDRSPPRLPRDAGLWRGWMLWLGGF